MTSAPPAIAFLCDEQGRIETLLQDTLQLADTLPLGALLPRWATRGSVGKALSFLNDLRTCGYASDWEINITHGNTAETLYFIGSRLNQQFLVVAARKAVHSRQCYQMLHPAPNNNLSSPGSLQINDYDEFSRLNNELINAQRKLAQQNAELERLNREKNHFLGMAAHDLRSPLHAIMLYSELLLEGNLESQQREYLTVIFESSVFLSRLVDNLLDVATIEAGQLNLQIEPVHLIRWISNILALNRPLAARKDIQVVLHTRGLPEYALFDPHKMAQVLHNLLGNAIKFSQPNTQITLLVEQQNGTLHFKVRDEGPGIDMQQQARLFEFFSQGVAMQPDGQKNTGLGLAICRHIVEAHGGKIGFTPAEPHGAIFEVQLTSELV